MNRSFFIAIFVSAHIAFVLLTIHKQNAFIQLSYEKQRKEKAILALREQKKQLTQERYALHSHEQVKKVAQQQLHLEPIKISQIRKVSLNDQH